MEYGVSVTFRPRTPRKLPAVERSRGEGTAWGPRAVSPRVGGMYQGFMTARRWGCLEGRVKEAGDSTTGILIILSRRQENRAKLRLKLVNSNQREKGHVAHP